jgi:long-subunit acyl-CoA synthetase (AMP-forming)
MERCSADEVGEIIIIGPNVMLGYYKNEKETDDAFFEGSWYKTGDLGMFDQDGYLFIVDRKKDMIISGGENIYCLKLKVSWPDIRKLPMQLYRSS